MDMGYDDIVIAKGQDFSYGPVTKEIDDVEVTIAGATVYAQARASRDRGSDLICDFTVVIVGNSITLSLTDTQTAAIPRNLRDGWWDILVIYADGTDEFWIGGNISFLGSATVKP